MVKSTIPILTVSMSASHIFSTSDVLKVFQEYSIQFYAKRKYVEIIVDVSSSINVELLDKVDRLIAYFC